MKVTTREVDDYSAILHHLDAHKIPYYTFHHKSMAPLEVAFESCLGTPLPKQHQTN